MRSITWLASTALAVTCSAAFMQAGCGSGDADPKSTDATSGSGASTGQNSGGGGNGAGGGTGGSGTGGSSYTGGGPAPTEIATCQGKTYQCGDLQDNDEDGLIDSQDPDCLGPCDDNEAGYYPNIPGGNSAPCQNDCYFDQDSGSGNDKCCWDHRCDELDPQIGCSYNEKTTLSCDGGGQQSCDQLYNKQSDACLDFCGPLTPNGCDCFGCCVLPGAPTPVWLGTNTGGGSPKYTCTLADAGDPTKCAPCTQVAACLKECGKCQLCLGKTELPPECDEGGGGGGGSPGEQCPGGEQKCGLAGQDPCSAGYSCITGCCQIVPK